MKSTKINKKYFLLFTLLGIASFLLFLYLVYSVLRGDFLGSQQKSASKSSVYRTPTGEEVFYDPEYVTKEDVKKILEEIKHEE